jgi:hypothetical protein
MTPFMSSSHIIQETIDDMTGSLQILWNHPGFGKSGLVIFYHNSIENGPYIRDIPDDILFHLLSSLQMFHSIMFDTLLDGLTAPISVVIAVSRFRIDTCLLGEPLTGLM